MQPLPVAQGERGVAFIMALVIVLILAAITLAMGFITSAEVDIHRLSRWDTLAQYLAQAGLDHQIYAFKGNKGAAAVGYVEYPQIAGYAPGLGPFWYLTDTSTAPCGCTVNCTGNPTSRRWTICSNGEVRRYDTASGTWTTLQRHSLRAQVEITYFTCDAGTNACPADVTLLRWERVEP